MKLRVSYSICIANKGLSRGPLSFCDFADTQRSPTGKPTAQDNLATWLLDEVQQGRMVLITHLEELP